MRPIGGGADPDWCGARSCFSGLMSCFKNREAPTLLQMEIQPLLMSGAFAWKILFPGEVNIYCKSTVCSGAESGARILQETIYVRAVLGANSKFPEAECEELVLHVAYSQTGSSSPAWALQCWERSDQNNSWVPLLWLCHCRCTDVVREGWKTALLVAPPQLRAGKEPDREFRDLRGRKMLLEVTGFLKHSCIIPNSTRCVCCFLGPSQAISRQCLCEETNQQTPTKPHALKAQPLVLQLARKIPAVEMFVCINAHTGMADSVAAALHCLECFLCR